MKEIKDRNTEQHWEGNSVNTESNLYSPMLIYFPPKEDGGEATDFINMI